MAEAATKSRKMTLDELGSILDAEKSDALAAQRASKLSDDRTTAMKYYLGDMTADMPTVQGRSSAVSTDVFDTIEGMMPALMDIFAGSDEVVRFEPVGPEDVEAAQQETEYVNHVFLQKNAGFLVLYSFIKDALLSKVGVVKVHWSEETSEERETYLDQSPDAFAVVLQDPQVEVVEHSEHEGMHDFTVVKKQTYGCAKVEPVPPEEFGIARRARSIRDASYCFHEVSRFESDLIDEGYDAAQVKALPTYGETQKTEENARDTVNEGGETRGDSSMNRAMRPIRVTEHYVKIDYDGSGAKLYRVTTGGEAGKVLIYNGQPSVIPIDAIPFAAMTPVIMTHRFFGRSIADLIMEIQRIKTALLRALLDNAYLATNPRTEVSEAHASDTTLDDLLVARPGGLVRVKQPGGVNILKHPDVGGDVYPLFQYQDSVREWRTGVTRQAMGLDANALQNQSATAAMQLFNAAQARLKLVARIFAETGIKDMFWLLHGTIRKHGGQADTVRLNNKWVLVDPRQWKSRKDMTINVGLGTGGKMEEMAHVTQLMTVQKEMIAGGKVNLVSDKNLYNSAKRFVRVIGDKDVDSYFTDPATVPPPQPAPDPEMIKVQGQLEVEKMQAQADVATMREKATLEAQIKTGLHELTMQQKREEHAMKMEQMRAQRVSDAVKAAGKDNGGGEEGEGQGNGGNGATAALIAEIMAALQQMNGPKRVRKDADGSWISEPVH